MSRLNNENLDEKIVTMKNDNQSLRERIVQSTVEINDQEQEFKELQLLCQELSLDFKDA